MSILHILKGKKSTNDIAAIIIRRKLSRSMGFTTHFSRLPVPHLLPSGSKRSSPIGFGPPYALLWKGWLNMSVQN